MSRRTRELQRDAFRPMEVLTLRREPDNPHDPNAVAVFDRKGRTMIGYVPKQDARRIAALLTPEPSSSAAASGSGETSAIAAARSRS